MSFGNSFLSKMGLGDGKMSSLLPLQTFSPLRSPDEHDLADLSPRPDDALLAEDLPYGTDNSPTYSSRSTRSRDNRNAKGKAIAFAYPERQPYARSRRSDPAGDFTATDSSRGDLRVPPGIWRPKLRPENRHSSYGNAAPRTSLVESIFLGRPDRTNDRPPRSEADNTFNVIQRREGQMQRELQNLLDAQYAALERDLDGGNTAKHPLEGSKRTVSPDSVATTLDSKPTGESVVPVRQPKRKTMSKRQARIGIARSVTMLADLKNEEDAYIATALAERKAALSRLRNLSSKRKSIVTEMKALEEDHELPIKNEIAQMEDDHRKICSSIERLEEKLQILRRTKVDMERRLVEAKSTRDSSLSGYKGALKQCDQGISELMKYPGVQVLEMEQLQEQWGEEVTAVLAGHVSGFQFLSLRPERRTMEMARDWWEGEISVLEQRKTTVDKERAALEEGSEVWQQVVGMLSDFEGRLNSSLQIVVNKDDSGSDEPMTVLQDLYKALKKAISELQTLHDYVEAQGWNLLIVAIGAEIAHFLGLKEYLADMIREAGYDDGSITPKTRNGDNLVDVHENGVPGGEMRKQEPEPESEPYDEVLSRSVVRRWDEMDEQENQVAPPPDLLGSGHREGSDNEVPPGLLSEVHHESEDDQHNDVPAEFLSMHSPPQSRGGQGQADKLSRGHLRRDSSENENEVPPDLLAEGRRDDDAVD
ncbi:hypothetical protein GGR52DRAFT_519911 [Hypoxylon sp. FL1284]|nr:hypothetical protein GGR52DRAFT_519911 [Hypoxylon sp. FL1284]